MSEKPTPESAKGKAGNGQGRKAPANDDADFLPLEEADTAGEGGAS